MSRTVEKEKTVRVGGNGQVTEGSEKTASQTIACIVADWTMIEQR